jgi:hypothetical protein
MYKPMFELYDVQLTPVAEPGKPDTCRSGQKRGHGPGGCCEAE